VADKDDRLGVVELDASLAGTESGPQVVPWQIRMIVWEWLNRMIPWLERRVDLRLFCIADKDDRLGVVEPNASLAGTESRPHAVPWQIRMIIWEWLNRMLPWLERRVDLMLFRTADKDNCLGVVEPDASLAGTDSKPHAVSWQKRMIVWE
jgi:hypothetical protein